MKKIKIYLALILIIVVTTSLFLFTLRKGIYWGADYAQYILQAKGLSTGNLDRIIELSVFRFNNDSRFANLILKPWGLPILLSPIYHHFGLNFFAMKIYLSIFFILSLPFIFLIFKDKIGDRYSLLLVAIFALNPYFLTLKERVLSEFPFLLFFSISFLLIQKTVIEKKYVLNVRFSYFLLGFFIFSSFLIRTQGILLLALLFICEVVEVRKNREGFKPVAVLPYLIFLFLFILNTILLPAGDISSYYIIISHWFGLKSILKNLFFYFSVLFVFFNAFNIKGFAPLNRVIYGTTIPFALIGIFNRLKEDYPYVTYLILNFLLCVFYPFTQGLRLFIYVIPFYIYFIFTGLKKSMELNLFWKSRKFKINLIYIFSFIMIFSFISKDIHYKYNSKAIDSKTGGYIEGPCMPASKEMFTFIKKHIPQKSSIIFSKPRIINLFTDRKSGFISGFRNILKSNFNYLICGVKLSRFIRNPIGKWALNRYSKNFKLIFKNKHFRIYKIIRTPRSQN